MRKRYRQEQKQRTYSVPVYGTDPDTNATRSVVIRVKADTYTQAQRIAENHAQAKGLLYAQAK